MPEAHNIRSDRNSALVVAVALVALVAQLEKHNRNLDSQGHWMSLEYFLVLRVDSNMAGLMYRKILRRTWVVFESFVVANPGSCLNMERFPPRLGIAVLGPQTYLSCRWEKDSRHC